MSIASRIESMTEHLTNDWGIIDSLGLHAKKLPKGYTQVDYIQSSGTQYIDTGVNADNNMDLKIDMQYIEQRPVNNNTNFGAIYNGSDGYRRWHFTKLNSNIVLYVLNSGTNIHLNTYDTNRHTYYVKTNENKVIYDGIEKDLPDYTTSDTTLNLWLFGRNSNVNNLIYYNSSRLYSCQMYYENELVRDFIPCYHNSDNEVGLYDIVNDVFYTNQGTGAFTYGEIQEEHIDRNLENLSLPLSNLYNEVSDKTDLSQNGVVGRTSQESTTGKNLAIFEQPDTTISGLTIIYDNATGKISIKGKATATTGVRVSKQMQTNIPSGTYTLSVNSALPTLINYVVTDSQNNNTAFRMSAGSTSVTNTLSNNGVQASLFVAIENNVQYDLEFYMQLESGSTATDFEPFTYGASPNQDYPQPINNLSGDVPYKVTGKNLLKIKNNYSYELNGITISTNGDVITIDGTANTNINYSGFFIFDNHYYAESGKTYTETIKYISGTCPGNTGVVNLRNDDNTEGFSYQFNIYGGMGTLKEQDITQTINVSNTGSVARNGYINSIQLMCNNGATFDNYKIKIQIEEGSTATSYEPYIEPQTFNIPLGDIELCKIDTYEDKIYSSDGRFYLNKNIKKHLFTTSDVIQKGGSSTDGYARCGWGSSSEIATSDFDKILVKCNKFLGMSQNNNNASLTGEHWYCSLSNTDNYKIMFRCGDTEYTRDTFPEFIKNNEIIVYYPLKEPTNTEITQENYPSLYNALKQIQDYLTAYKINKEFILGYSSPEIEY